MLAVVVTALLAGMSCSSTKQATGLGAGCTLNSDCSGALICSFGLCHIACVTSKDCTGGAMCLLPGECELPQESTCSSTLPCVTGLVCASDSCKSPCTPGNPTGDPGGCLGAQTCSMVAGGMDSVCLDNGDVGALDGGSSSSSGGGSGGSSSSDGGSGGSSGGGGNVADGAGGDGSSSDASHDAATLDGDATSDGPSQVDATSSDAGMSDGATQEAAAPVVVVPSLNGRQINAIAVDEANLYWLAQEPLAGGNTAVMSVPKGGGTPTLVYNTNVNAANGMAWGSFAVDDTSVYFDYETCCPDYYPLVRVAKDGGVDGGAATVLLNLMSLSEIQFTIDDTNIYTAVGGGISSVLLDGGAERVVVNTTGPGPLDPVTGQPIGFPGITALATDGQNVYYTAGGGPVWLLSVPVGGGSPVILVSGKSSDGGTNWNEPAGYISVMNGLVFWVADDPYNGDNGYSMYGVSVDGGSPTLVAAANVFAASGALSDGSNLYYVAAGGLWTVPVAGGTPRLVFPTSAANGVGQLAIDDTSAYVIVGSSVVKVAK